MCEKKTTIQVTKSTREALASLGGKDDSFDTIINKLIMQRDVSNQWKKFLELDVASQKEVMMKMHEYNNDYMFSVSSDKGYAGLQYAYYNDDDVRNTMNISMKELDLI